MRSTRLKRRPSGAESLPSVVAGRMGSIMPTAKEEVRDLLENLPDEATFDDIEYQIYVLHEIREGIAEADRGELIDHEEVKARMAKWLGE